MVVSVVVVVLVVLVVLVVVALAGVTLVDMRLLNGGSIGFSQSERGEDEQLCGYAMMRLRHSRYRSLLLLTVRPPHEFRQTFLRK
jgi:hypothetical protein